MTQPAVPPRKPRALIADDQREVRESLRLLLKAEGYETETAASPVEVVQCVTSRELDVVLMDLNYTRDTTSGKEGLDLALREIPVPDLERRHAALRGGAGRARDGLQGQRQIARHHLLLCAIIEFVVLREIGLHDPQLHAGHILGR